MNTHFSLTIQYHTDNDIDFRIVGALITPLSIHQTSAEKYDCEETANVQLIENGPLNIVYTYSVKFEKSEKKWGTRWDNYLHVTKPKIHWFNLVNSIVIALFLTGMVAMILLRALHRDISRYNQVDQVFYIF